MDAPIPQSLRLLRIMQKFEAYVICGNYLIAKNITKND